MGLILESFINGSFNGWNGETLFKLGNSYWIQAKHSIKHHHAYRPSAKVIEEGGIYYLEVQGLSDRLQVKKVSNVIESQITSDFNGWNGDTVFELANGQVWQQANYAYSYHYAYRPNAMIYPASGGYKLKVDGMANTINVRRIN